MKLHIEVEIGPDEVGLATELLNTLRTLTEHVKVRYTQPAGSFAPGPAAAPPLQQQAPYANGSYGGAGQHQGNGGPPPPQGPLQELPPRLAPQPQPHQPPPQQPTPTQVAPSRPPAYQAQQPAPPSGPPPQSHYEAIVSQAKPEIDGDDLHTKQASEQLQAMLTARPADLQLFFDAFMVVAFRPEVMDSSVSVMPYMYLLGHFKEPLRNKVRDFIIPKVLKHLTIKRPLDAERLHFYAQAEAFAALVLMDFVSIAGATQTIVTLLKKPDNRCAAITMLGKTIELCSDQLLDKLDEASLEKLRGAVAMCEPDVYEYDLKYINETIGWQTLGQTHPSSRPAASG